MCTSIFMSVLGRLSKQTIQHFSYDFMEVCVLTKWFLARTASNKCCVILLKSQIFKQISQAKKKDLLSIVNSVVMYEGQLTQKTHSHKSAFFWSTQRI